MIANASCSASISPIRLRRRQDEIISSAMDRQTRSTDEMYSRLRRTMSSLAAINLIIDFLVIAPRQSMRAAR